MGLFIYYGFNYFYLSWVYFYNYLFIYLFAKLFDHIRLFVFLKFDNNFIYQVTTNYFLRLKFKIN